MKKKLADIWLIWMIFNEVKRNSKAIHHVMPFNRFNDRIKVANVSIFKFYTDEIFNFGILITLSSCYNFTSLCKSLHSLFNAEVALVKSFRFPKELKMKTSSEDKSSQMVNNIYYEMQILKALVSL